MYSFIYVSCARWVWTVWKAAVQKRYAQHHQEDLALQLWAATVQCRVSVCMCKCGTFSVFKCVSNEKKIFHFESNSNSAYHTIFLNMQCTM